MAASVIRILLIEDDDFFAELVSRCLTSADAAAVDVKFELTWVQYLRDGLEQLSNADVVLLDMRLPDCVGLETLDRVLQRDPDATVIVQTGMADETLAIWAAREGAQDFIHKDGLTAAHLIRSVLYAMERRQRRLMWQKLQAVEQEREAAGELQRLLMPKSAPQISGFDIAGRFWPFDMVGGDYFDYFVTDEHLILVIADVSGHGLASAMVVVGLRRLLRSCVETHTDVAEIMQIANRAVFDDTDTGRFATAFLGRLNIETREVAYATAGHVAFVIPKSGPIERLDSGNLPLGLVRDDIVFRSRTVTLQPDALLVVMTDGIYEATSSTGQLWGIDALLQVIQEHHDRTADEIITAVNDTVLAHCDDHPVGDDMAIIVVKTL